MPTFRNGLNLSLLVLQPKAGQLYASMMISEHGKLLEG